MIDSTDVDFNALAQAIDTTWGHSSTPKTASYSVKLTLQGNDRLLVSYAAIVNFNTEKQMIEMKRRYADEATTVVTEVVKQIKANYKSLTGETLKLNLLQESLSDSLEITSLNVHTARRTAYFRRKVLCEIG